MTDERARDTACSTCLSVPANLAEVAAIRRHVTSTVLSAGDDAQVAHDIALAASELSTNVVQYAGTDEFTVTCRRNDRCWVLEVSHAHGVDLTVAPVDDPSAPGGRGLRIVRAVMDSVDLVDRDDGVAVRCVKSVR